MIWRMRFALSLLFVIYQSTQSLGLVYDDNPWMRAETASYYMQCLRDQINSSPRITNSMKNEMNIMSDTMTATIQKMIGQGMMSESKIKIITKTFATAIAEVIVSEASSADEVPALIYEIRNAIVKAYVQTTGEVDQQSVDEMMKVINILAQDKYRESGKDDGTSAEAAAAGRGYWQGGFGSGGADSYGTAAAGSGYLQGGYGSGSSTGAGTSAAGSGYDLGKYRSDVGTGIVAAAAGSGYAEGEYGSDNTGGAGAAAASSGGYGQGEYGLGNDGGIGAVATGSGNRQKGYEADSGVGVGASASTGYGQVGYGAGNGYELGGYGLDNTAITTGAGGAVAGIGSGIGKGVGTRVAVGGSKYGLGVYGYDSGTDTGSVAAGAGFGLGRYGSGGNAGVGVTPADSGYGQGLYGSGFRVGDGDASKSSVSKLGEYNLGNGASAVDSVSVSGYRQRGFGSGSGTDTDSASAGIGASAISALPASTLNAGVYKPKRYGRGRDDHRRFKKGRNGKRYRAGGKRKQKNRRRNRGPNFATLDLGQRRYDAYGQPIDGYNIDKSAGIEVASGANIGYGQGRNDRDTWPSVGFAATAPKGYEEGAGSGAEGTAAGGYGSEDGSAGAADGGYGGYEGVDAGDGRASPVGYKQGVYASGLGGFLPGERGFVDDFAAAIGDGFGQEGVNGGYVGETPNEYELVDAGSPLKSAGAFGIGQAEESNIESSEVPVVGNEEAEFIGTKTGDKGADDEYGQGDYVVDVGGERAAGDEYGKGEGGDTEAEGATVTPAEPLVFAQGNGQGEGSDNRSAATDENGQGENAGAYAEAEEGDGEFRQGDNIVTDPGAEGAAAGGYRQEGNGETGVGSAEATDYGDEQARYERPNTGATGEAVALGYGDKGYDGVSPGAAGYVLGAWPSYYGYGQGSNNGESVGAAGASDDGYGQGEYDGENAGSVWPSYYGYGQEGDNGESFQTSSDVGYGQGGYDGGIPGVPWSSYGQGYGYGQGAYGGVNTLTKGKTAGGYSQGRYSGRPFGAVEASYYGYKPGSGYQGSRPGFGSVAAESGSYEMGYGKEAGNTENIAPVFASASVTNYVKRLYSPDAASRITSASSDLANGGMSALPRIISNLSKSVDRSGLKECEVLVQVLIEALTACMHVISSSVVGNVAREVPQSVADTVSQSLTKAWAPESYSSQPNSKAEMSAAKNDVPANDYYAYPYAYAAA